MVRRTLGVKMEEKLARTVGAIGVWRWVVVLLRGERVAQAEGPVSSRICCETKLFAEQINW